MEHGNGYVGAESIYRIARKIKRREQSLYNALRSIYEDAGFVMEIQGLRPKLPLLANIRCGLWYARKFDDLCYFKSTDGHTGNWSFNPTRLNMHVAFIAAQKEGCMIVDATRKGKRFPDSMSKTIPIWTCVINRAVAQVLGIDYKSNNQIKDEEGSPCWDCSLYLPNWVSGTEKSRIESRMDDWMKLLLATGTDLNCLATSLRKPLRPLWISQKSLIWLNEVPDSVSLAFTPVILISASRPSSAPQRMSDSEFGWNYIPGAADDEESWARGLTPTVFWKHALDIISGSPDECNRKVAEIVERHRVHRSLWGESIPQARVKMVDSAAHNVCIEHPTTWNSEDTRRFHWIGNTGLVIGSAHSGEESLKAMDSVIDCSGLLHNVHDKNEDCYLNLQIEGYKFDRYSLQSHLFVATEFARMKLQKGNKVLVCCKDGEDISVSVCLAILLSCFNQDGVFDNGKTLESTEISKWDVRQRLVYLCGYVSNARPARGSLRQVYNFLLQNCRECIPGKSS